MATDDCIVISDSEEPANDVSVLIIEHVKKQENAAIKCANLDASIIDLTKEEPPPDPSRPLSPPSFSSPQRSPAASSSPPRSPPYYSCPPQTPPLFSSPTPSPPFFSSHTPSPPPPPPTSESPEKSQSLSPKSKRSETRRLKLKQKEEENLLREANRANAANKALQNCTAILDKNILKIINDEEEISLRTLFDESMLTYRYSDYPKVANSITWSYKRVEVECNQCVSKFKDADWIVVVVPGNEYLKYILKYRDNPDDPGSLEDFICDIRRRSKCDVILIVYNLANYLKNERLKDAKTYRKNFKNRFEGTSSEVQTDEQPQNNTVANIGTTDLQDLRLMLEVDVKHKHPSWKFHIDFYEKTQDVVQALVRYTSSIAKFEIKSRTKSATNLDWAISMDKEKAVDPSKSNEDLTKLWITQLQQFSQITLPIAKAIAAEYPSPSALLDQYKNLTTSEAEDLLAGLYVQRNLKRQIGPNISKKIHCFMTCEDPDVHIGYS